MSGAFDVVIVGTGHGGAQTAIALRKHGFEGSIGMIGEEQFPPYERPPLSKDYLAGSKSFERLLIRPAQFWAERSIEIISGQRVETVDPTRREVTTSGGLRVAYGSLVWAAGGSARRLGCEGHDLAGVHSIRNKADVDAMVDELVAVERICVIGGGFIGLEAAAVLTKLGKQITVIEAQERVLSRVAGPALSRFFEIEHRSHGVDLRLGVGVDRILGDGDRVTGVRLADGNDIPCDMVIVGIGIVPEMGPLLNAGARCGNGVEVDAYCRTSLPDVYAIGDCALHGNVHADWTQVRLESVQNANDMAMTVAKTLCGGSEPYCAVPWFWSEQYDLKLQTIGLSSGHDVEIVRGDPASRSFSIAYLRAGRVIAFDCVNAVRDYVQGKGLILRVVDLVRLGDPSISLKDVASAAERGTPSSKATKPTVGARAV
ncbi:FAD/NAD(P)-binding oxidoreductase [Sphingomonas sp. TREG-RG-20F-R18-01]|uniref:NAD(P)/FAD-dependent oxidoreductase n=1 Tax=Sphingomonas sp. TREG-RG-20F-R18-01 TaxID=2914982 RepID=UPI001F573CDC|nr:FAD/NAD(P)-binding oxidoreductase [Sphingomonas sp. TREG-RG-20F-R18-01]